MRKYSSVFVALLGVLVGALAVLTFQKAQQNRRLMVSELRDWRKLNLVLQSLDEHYVDTVDRKAVTDAAITAALGALDPHSVYMPPAVLEESETELAGNFDGIGIQFNVPNDTVVGANMSKTPSTVNPNHFLTIFCTTRGDEVVKGDRPFTAYVKYTQENDKSHAIGTPDEHFTLTTISFSGRSAVADVNAAKAVSSVKYYNAAGVASDNAFEGVNIVVTKYADGSQSVTKVVK